jgi:hypothetical protein
MVLRLQRTLGNQAVLRLRDARRAEPTPSAALALRQRLAAAPASRAAAATTSSRSPALALRTVLRSASVAPTIQRDIKGAETFESGKLGIEFTKTEGAAVGDRAFESGTITFTPSKKAKPSAAIHMIQTVRTIDTSGAKEKDYAWTGAEAPRNAMMTTAAKGVAAGWYVDQVAGELKKRTKKTDPEQKPYYDKTFTTPRPGQNQVGKTGTPPVAATLDDAPGFSGPLRFLFNTSVKGDDNGVFYGTVLWGFETYHNKGGVTKIKGEYKNFRTSPGATLEAAVEKFNEYYQNPGTPGAPTK